MKRLPLPLLRLGVALLIGTGCALYAPAAPFALTAAAALKLMLWSGVGFAATFGLRQRLHKRLLRFTVPLSFGLALSFMLGARLQSGGALYLSWLDIPRMLGIWALGFLLLCHLFDTVPARFASAAPRRPLLEKKLFWAVLVSFCILSGYWLLAYFPIMTNYDIHAHLAQIASGQYETHHSLLYTLLLQALLGLSSLLGLGNAWALCMLGLFQTAVMGLCFAYGLRVMHREGAHPRAVLVAAVYYCLFPLFSYFAFSTTKDTLFACFMLLTGIELYRLSRGAGICAMIRMAVFGTLMLLLRYNGALTLLLFLLAAAGYALVRLLRHKRITKALTRALLLLPVILLLGTGTGTLLNLAAGAKTPDTVRRDMLSLPLQQMARVLQTATDEADIQRIEGLFGVDDIPERYRPDITDPVKAAFLYPDENTVSALRAWLKFSVQYPKEYLESFLQLTRGAWFVDDLSHTKIDYWLSYTGYLETTQKYTEADIPIAYHTVSPALRAFIDRAFMENRYLDVPLLLYLFSPGVQAWITVIALCYAAYRRRRHARRMLVFTLCVLLPVLLLPCMIPRYFLPVFMLNPLCLLALTIQKENPA